MSFFENASLDDGDVDDDDDAAAAFEWLCE